MRSTCSGGFSGAGGPVNSYTGSDNPNWEFADSFTSVHVKHTIGVGIDYRHWRLIRNLDDDFYGDYTFSARTAAINTVGCTNPASPLNNNLPLCGTGNAIGDLLTGYYNIAAGFVPGPLSPTTTCWVTLFPSLTTWSAPSDPVPVRALFGTVTPEAWSTITDAVALMPGLTRESLWSRVRVAS